MFATLAGGYPLGALPGVTDPLAEARHRRASDLSSPDAHADAADRVVTELVAEQAAAGLAMVHDAWVRWPGGDGLALARGLLAGTIGPAEIATAWRWADDGIDAVVKQVLPGPWSASLALADGDPARAASIRPALADALAATTRALLDATCPVIQVQEPGLAALGDDPGALHDAAGALEALVAAVPEGTHLSLALTGAAPHRSTHDRIAALPYRSFLIDVTAGEDAWRLIEQLPAEQGVVVGAADARKPGVDDPEMLVWAATLAAESRGRGHLRVGIATSGDIDHLDRRQARRKIESMGTAVVLAKLGPLSDVARALQADPATCPIGSLRAMMAAHAAAQR